jgi:hypothetical protein
VENTEFHQLEPAIDRKGSGLKAEGYRSDRCCTKVSEGFELTYSFDKDHV